MVDSFQVISSTLTLIGFGSILGGYISYLLDKQKEREFKVIEQKEKRYKSCILYMDAYFNPQNIKYLSSRQPDIDDASDILEYLKMEYHEMMLYAAKNVILAVKVFIKDPTQGNFVKTVLAMRKDLSSKRSDLSVKEVNLA